MFQIKVLLRVKLSIRVSDPINLRWHWSDPRADQIEAVSGEFFEMMEPIEGGRLGNERRAIDRRTGEQVTVRRFPKRMDGTGMDLSDLTRLEELNLPGVVHTKGIHFAGPGNPEEQGDTGSGFIVTEFMESGSLREAIYSD